MHFLNALTTTLALAGGAVAQMAGSSSSPMTAGTTTVHVVTVSNSTGKKLMFSPNNIQAAVGDMVQFQFQGGNHTVTQSTFAQPCVPINNVMSNVTGFFSGFQMVPMGATQLPTYTLMVNNTMPIWFYCSQGKHCQSGMVGAINAAQSGAKTVQAFAQLAASAPQNLAPGSSGSSSSNSSSSGSSSSNSTSTGSSGSSSSAAAAPAGSTAPAVSTGGASGSVWATSQELYMGASVAGLVASFMMMM